MILAIDNDGLNTSVPVTVYILNRNDFCPELINNSTALFFNTDLWLNNSNEKFNQYYLQLIDGDNDTCSIKLLNFNNIFQIDSIERNQFLLYAQILPEREYYVLKFRLQDHVNKTIDQPCIQYTHLILTTGTNKTNQTAAIDAAREYLEALDLASHHSHSYFNLTSVSVLFVFILLIMAIMLGFISFKLIFFSLNSHQQRKPRKNKNDIHTLYRLQSPTETQLPLLDNGSGEHSFTSSLNIAGNKKLIQNKNINYSIDNDEEQQV